MKYIIPLLLLSSVSFASEASREIPLRRVPLCDTWIPEGNVMGCISITRTTIATRTTIEALVEEIKELKARVKELEDKNE